MQQVTTQIRTQAYDAYTSAFLYLIIAGFALLLSGCQTLGSLGGKQAEPTAKAVGAQKEAQVSEREEAPQRYLDDQSAGVVFQHYLSAVLSESRGDIASAGQHYLRVMQADKSNVRLQDRAFSFLLASGDYHDAVEVANIITASDKESQPLVQLLLVFDEAITGNYAKAQERLQDMRKNAPNLIQFELIDQYIQLANGGDPQTLIENLQAFDVGAGMLVYKYYHLGRMHLHAGNPEAAIKAFRNGQLIEPGSLFIVKALGDALMATGKFDEAEAVFNGFLNLNANSLLVHDALKQVSQKKQVALPEQAIDRDLAEVMYGLASMMVGQEVNITARQFLHLALMAQSEHQMARFMLGLLEEQDGNTQRATSNYEKVKKGAAPYLAAQARMSEILFKTGEAEQATANLKRLIDDYPDVVYLNHPLAQLYYDQQNYQEAIKHYTALINTFENPNRRHAPVFFARGAAHERMRHYEKAAQDMETSLKLEPNNPVVLNYLGYMLLDQGQNLDDAYDYIRQAAHLRPHDGAIVDSLGWVYYQKGQFETAIRYLEQAVSLLPNDPVINMHLGDAYHKKGRTQEALVKWQRALSLEPEEPEHVERLKKLLAQ